MSVLRAFKIGFLCAVLEVIEHVLEIVLRILVDAAERLTQRTDSSNRLEVRRFDVEPPAPPGFPI